MQPFKCLALSGALAVLCVFGFSPPGEAALSLGGGTAQPGGPGVGGVGASAYPMTTSLTALTSLTKLTMLSVVSVATSTTTTTTTTTTTSTTTLALTLNYANPQYGGFKPKHVKYWQIAP